MKNRLVTSLLRLVLPTVIYYAAHTTASFSPFGKWKVENANSYIIYNGIYIPNPEQMIDPGSILDSLNPVSSFNNFWKAVPSFGGFFGGGGDEQYNNPYAQYGEQYGDQYPDASTFPNGFDGPQPSGSEPVSTVVSPEQQQSSAGLSSLFGFSGGSDIPTDPSATFSAETEPAESSGGFSSYLPWNWFSGNSRSGAQLGLDSTNQLPDEFSFLLDGPFQVNRRSDISPVADPTHVPEKEKVSVYLRPIGQGSFLRYELHEPINDGKLDKAQQAVRSETVPVQQPSPLNSQHGRGKRSIPKEGEESPSKYVPRSFRKRVPATPRTIPITKKKSTVQYNRRRYQQMQKQKKHFKSTSQRSLLKSQIQKIKKSDDKVMDMDSSFPCPKVGMWSYNGEVCIAVGPTPTWACKPNDLVASGKLVICRNKILMS